LTRINSKGRIDVRGDDTPMNNSLNYEINNLTLEQRENPAMFIMINGFIPGDKNGFGIFQVIKKNNKFTSSISNKLKFF
jgi:hypothetical protein